MNPVITFLVVAALLTIVVAWWLLRPLWRSRVGDDVSAARNVEALRIEMSELQRDRALGLLNDASFAEAERELEARVLRESAITATVGNTPRYKKSAIAIATLLPIFALGGYIAIGTPQGLIAQEVRPDPKEAESQMDELFRVAEERLKAEPNDAKGWYLLARAQASVGRFPEAMRSYEKLTTLTPNDADMWADYADAAAGATQGTMAGKPLDLLKKALAIDPKQPKALLLRGTHEMQINDLAAAEKTFTLAKSVSEPNTGFAQIAENALKDIAARGGSSAVASSDKVGATNVAPSALPASAAPVATNAALANLSITLSDEARAALTKASGASIFVIVRTAGVERGPPLAAKKLAPGDLSKPITLAASDAMIGGGGLAAGAKVDVSARLSMSGQPTPQPGDWQSAKQSATLAGETKISIRIDQAVN
jgi:cytochrome c-type biogenesis protein CcmH